MNYEEAVTTIFFKDDSEVTIKGFYEAEKFIAEHEDEIFLTYTDWK